MFTTCPVLSLMQALREWERKGAVLPEAVRVEVEELEQQLADFEREMGDPFDEDGAVQEVTA